MRITSLVIENFRGIANLDTGELGDTVIIAGQNGSGKSCIFDAIRLLKSVYGGYQQNEWQQFFTEFQIQLQGRSKNLVRLFNDSSKSLLIKAKFRLSDREKAYISDHAEELLEETIWQSVLPEAFQYGGYHKAMFAAQFRERQPEVTLKVKGELPFFKDELNHNQQTGQLVINHNGQMNIEPSKVLKVVFTCYRPREIGVIDFHGAQRHYGRENVQGINLSLDQSDQTKSQSSLYNSASKYNNVKSEMAGSYIKEILSEKASGVNTDAVGLSLTETMQELFTSFFPEKRFLGPRPNPDGTLAFPVIAQNGNEHDLDELSSGEKEILYGYLRIRSSAPRDSIILLDEPELHLNPRLIRGLPQFYKKHLGETLHNQLWLVTHSDALIREAVGKPGFNVFHMLPCGADGVVSSQLRVLAASKDLDLVLTDLVGDLATYRPGGKGVIFEGGGDSDFDKSLASTLFPDELKGINLISGANKTKVKALHEVLARAHDKGDLPTKFFAVVDADSGPRTANVAITEFSWNVYHIENYLLESRFVRDAFNSFHLSDKHTTVEEIALKLEKAARSVVPGILIRQIRDYANSAFIRNVDLSFNPDTLVISTELRSALERSMTRISSVMDSSLSAIKLSEKEAELRAEIEASFGDGSWKTRLPGRDILKRFVQAEKIPTNYESFRNMVMSLMASASHKPTGMADVISRICVG